MSKKLPRYNSKIVYARLYIKNNDREVIKMGWCNYVVIPRWNLAFQISRHVQTDNLNSINELLLAVNDFNFEDLEIKLRDINLDTVSKMTRVINASNIAQKTEPGIFLLWWLTLSNIKFEVIHENLINEPEYKAYKKCKFSI